MLTRLHSDAAAITVTTTTALPFAQSPQTGTSKRVAIAMVIAAISP